MPVAVVQAEVAKLQRAVAANPAAPAVFYFVGHGFQSNAENFLVPAGSDLNAVPAQLSKTCISLEREIFSKLKRPVGPAATVIMVDACRTPDRPRSPGEGYNQTLPPEGCHVAFATGPGKRAFAPNDPEKDTLFAEVLVAELAALAARSLDPADAGKRARQGRQPRQCHTDHRSRVRPERAAARARVERDRRSGLGARCGIGAAAAAPTPVAPPSATSGELAAVRAIDSPEQAAERLRAFLQKTPDGDDADIARLRLKDLETVLSAAHTARLDLDVAKLTREPAASRRRRHPPRPAGRQVRGAARRRDAACTGRAAAS